MSAKHKYDIRDLELTMKSVFDRTKFGPNGELYEVRFIVSQIGSLKIVIHPNEHPPPHFHVKSDRFEASITVQECKVLNGSIKSQDLKKIEYWHKMHKEQLIEVWNDLRPDDCQVGKI
jgi:hypothetical protein